ncbi:hypothetical protein HRR83_002904 [Exophiala dermatitidis]|uniref:Uncharacterized protein n=2 Tax=Exophiala dermatitidis TaxID=5970 RepID=H6BXS8_EXODN|nr:uncharacterized protein HMPREF1120_05456 [Exophiala dermatitidis NIH/UT8656]KAJ4516695.1 hypothetical protein HRR75_003354 [Exophiala dermatitidis]EHY57418.1 hypothetical protein HMPREF1120_05456 [Exophiala dermatitidis NIH/UT8656]KAJ4520665.1 hypothetical protein HRR74_003665 [Exophiala dermatitidis]KAJ4521807.1 hypothetical protein HRR73_003005 [Exophiala dermatitidis]KAJ4537691.1 hypothetical protein HRR76_005681 [Exophiala dermatitidis]
MSTPSIHVLGISAAPPGGDEVFSGAEDKSAAGSRLRLHGRITVLGQDESFDKVKIRLRGAVRTKIGARMAVEKLSTSSVKRTNLDFKPAYSPSQQHTDEQQLDFACIVPLTRDRRKPSSVTTPAHDARSRYFNDKLDRLVPSMTMSGSTYITRVTALKDRHLVQGSCEVVYWLETEFLRSQTGEVVRKLSCPADISSLTMLMRAEVGDMSSNDPTGHLEQVAKPQQLRTMDRFFHSTTRPEVSIQMPKILGYLVSDSSSLATGCRRLSIPVTVDVALPLSTSDQRQRHLEVQTQCLKCTVKTKWFTRKTFTTGPSSMDSAINNTTASAQDMVLTLPPLYNGSGDGDGNGNGNSAAGYRKYSTSMDLDLLLPESVAGPSITTELLHVNYILDLAMKFESEDMLTTPYTAHVSLPVTLRVAEPCLVSTRHTYDPLLGYLEEDVDEMLHAPPPYMP